jgi:hypothetical protein
MFAVPVLNQIKLSFLSPAKRNGREKEIKRKQRVAEKMECDKHTTEEIKEDIRQQMKSEESIDFRLDLAVPHSFFF